jgi:LCP family protein required for cell wall assembly
MTGGLVMIFLVVTLAAALFVVSWVRGEVSDAGLLPGLSGSEGREESPFVQRRPGQIIPTWTGTERVNVLLLGIDRRPGETDPTRTDTMMVLTLDPVSLEAGVLSLPRDLYVPIPGYKDDRINTAHRYGELYDHEGDPGGGPGLAMETVEYNLGVPIHYYVRVDFVGFVKIVDLIGGVDIYVEEPINDPKYPDHNYGYDPLYIEAGQHHFDGEMALKYARSRHGSNDFDRARRQQQVMLAFLDRVTDLGMLPQLAARADELVATLDESLSTNMTLDEMMALGGLALKVKRDEIRFGVIDHTATQNYVTPSGAQVLIPLRDRMREIRNYVFGEATSEGQTVEQEAASIALLNGTPHPGLAGTTRDYLQGQGLAVAELGNADRQDYAQSRIVVNRAKPSTVQQLITLLNLPPSAVVNGSNPVAEHDLVVILGSDYQGPSGP